MRQPDSKFQRISLKSWCHPWQEIPINSGSRPGAQCTAQNASSVTFTATVGGWPQLFMRVWSSEYIMWIFTVVHNFIHKPVVIMHIKLLLFVNDDRIVITEHTRHTSSTVTSTNHSITSSQTETVGIGQYHFIVDSVFFIILLLLLCLQCFDAVGWAAGRASSL